MPNFSITIVPGSPPTFSPNPQPVPPSSVVTWDNTTNVTHKLKLSDGRVTPDILAGQSSPEYAITKSITYQCTAPQHTGETGAINVTAIQDIPPG
jgi:hypothetical protein